MRRWLVWTVVLALAAGGCSAKPANTKQATTLEAEQAMTLEIGAAESLAVRSGAAGETVEITDPADMEHITENLEAMTFQDLGEVLADGWTYSLEWLDGNGNSLQKITLMGDGRTIVFDNHFYESVDGEIDLEFLEERFLTATEQNWGITLSVEDAGPTGLTLNISQSGSGQGDFTYGSPYGLEVCRDGQWEPVPYAAEETVAWEDIGYLLSAGESREERITWEHLYGSLEAGAYRLSKAFFRDGSAGDLDWTTVSVEFTIP